MLSHTWVDSQNVSHWLRFATFEAVGANDNTLAALNLALIFVGGFLDLRLNIATFDGCQSTTTLVDTLDIVPSSAFNLVSQRLDIVRPGQWIDHVPSTTFS